MGSIFKKVVGLEGGREGLFKSTWRSRSEIVGGVYAPGRLLPRDLL